MKNDEEIRPYRGKYCVSFVLTVPKHNTWNNRWSGQNDFFCVVRLVDKNKAEEIDGKSYDYDFKDGWMNRIHCEIIKRDEAKKLIKRSSGFMGYEWMIDSIIKNNKIIVEK